jgi:hypothetical protein
VGDSVGFVSYWSGRLKSILTMMRGSLKGSPEAMRKTEYTATGPMVDLTQDDSESSSEEEIQEIRNASGHKKIKTEEVSKKSKMVKGGKKAVGGGDVVFERMVDSMEQRRADKRRAEDRRYKQEKEQAQREEKRNRMNEYEQKLAIAEKLLNDSDEEVVANAKQLRKRTLAKMLDESE